jgi:hypothetical protein
MAGTTFQREFGGGSAGAVTLANGMSLETALAPANRQTWLATDVLAAGPARALDARIPISILDVQFGGVADYYNRGGSITTTSGSPTATLSFTIALLQAGHTMSIDGIAAPLIVLSVVGTTVTFTTNAPTSVASARLTFGTDNTAAFNLFFAYLLLHNIAGYVPAGRYLITDTVGIPEPSSGAGWHGPMIHWGGASNIGGRLAFQDLGGGASLIWGGAAGGTMMLFSRTLFTHFTGGLSLVGQSSTDPSGVFTLFGNRAGLGFKLSQDSTPTAGTGYLTIDTISFVDIDAAMQFGTNTSDNNTDTTVINRLVIWRCTNGVSFKHIQCLAYRFNWVHAASVPGYVFKSEGGGACEIGSLHFSSCGTAVNGSATTDTYGLDLNAGVNDWTWKVAVMRIEGATVRAIALRNTTTHLQIGMFTEANNSSTDRTLFYLQAGTLQGHWRAYLQYGS